MQKPIIKTNQQNPESTELIAESIIKIAEGFDKINKSQLTRRAIVLLLHDAIGSTKIGKKEIEMVLDAAPQLKKHYIKDVKPLKK